jgi:hypothetical protein
MHSPLSLVVGRVKVDADHVPACIVVFRAVEPAIRYAPGSEVRPHSSGFSADLIHWVNRPTSSRLGCGRFSGGIMPPSISGTDSSDTCRPRQVW